MPPVRAFAGPNWLGFRTLLRRELRRYTKEAWETVAAPAFSALTYFVVFSFALGPDRGTEEGDAILTFVLPGLVMMTVLLRSAETTSFSLLFDRMEGIMSDVLAAPLGPGEMTAAYALAGMMAGLVTGAFTLLAVQLVWPMAPARPLTALGFGALGALMLSLWGILIGLWSEKWDHLAAAFVFVTVPLTFLSGLFVPLEALPDPLAGLIRFNPVYHAIEGFRFAMLGSGSEPPALSAAVVAGTSLLAGLGCRRLIAVGYKLRP